MALLKLRLSLVVAAVIILALPAFAQVPGIVRLSLAEGDVQIDRNTGEGWEQAINNMPVTPGTRLYAAEGGHAELEFEDGSSVRLAGPAQITLAALTGGEGDAVSTVQVDSGIVYFDLRLQAGGQFRVEGPSGEAFSVNVPSKLRFKVDQQVAALAVIEGEAQVLSSDHIAPVRTGESYNYILGQPENAARLAQVPEQPDDGWNQQRDEQQPTLPPGADPAAAQLDAYGSYSDVPGYGQMWQPSGVGDDWSPYDYGAWSYYPDWGWTFVSGYPWGWTPFYYGNWCYISGRGWWWHHGPHHGPEHGPWRHAPWHPRPVYSGNPVRSFKPPVAPSQSAKAGTIGTPHSTVAVAGSGLHVGPISQTHAGGSSYYAPGSAHPVGSGVPAGGPGGQVGVNSSLVRGEIYTGGPVITGHPGRYAVSNPTVGGRSGYDVHRPPASAAPARTSNIEHASAVAYSRATVPPPHVSTPSAPVHVSAPVAHSGGGGSVHSSSGGSSFHSSGGGGGGHASSGGGGGHR